MGDDQPNTDNAAAKDSLEALSAKLDLADALWAQGRLIAARKLEEEVVEGRNAAGFGEQHAETLKAIGKLAVTLAAQGDLAEARRLQEEVIAGRRSDSSATPIPRRCAPSTISPELWPRKEILPARVRSSRASS